MRWLVAMVGVWCVVSLAAAQQPDDLAPFEPITLGYPDRAAALRPAGMVELSLTWARGTAYTSGEWEEDLLFQSVDIRVPYESVIFEASWTATFEHYAFGDVGIPYGTFDVFRLGNPRIGASWREQADRYRLELGAAVNLGWLYAEPIDPVHLRPPWPGLLWRYRGGWNWFQLAEGRLALIPHVRLELDLAPEAVIGAEVDLPVVHDVNQAHTVFTPQIAIEAAWRFLAYAMLGLRAQLVVIALPLRTEYGVATSIEPFLRIGHADRDIGYFGLLAAQIYLGPDHSSAPVDPRGSIAAKLGGGILF